MITLILFILIALRWLGDLYTIFIDKRPSNLGITSAGATIGFWYYDVGLGIATLIFNIVMLAIAVRRREIQLEKDLLEQAEEEDYQ